MSGSCLLWPCPLLCCLSVFPKTCGAAACMRRFFSSRLACIVSVLLPILRRLLSAWLWSVLVASQRLFCLVWARLAAFRGATTFPAFCPAFLGRGFVKSLCARVACRGVCFPPRCASACQTPLLARSGMPMHFCPSRLSFSSSLPGIRRFASHHWSPSTLRALSGIAPRTAFPSHLHLRVPLASLFLR
ncbi:hypothetical protein TRVL_05508 [Trypanosoma vivax]|nr:hypothetical protein TRVL_05508 [Trypanosoma vivax]